MLRKTLKIFFIKLPISFLIISVLWVLLYKFVPVRWTPLMLKRKIENIDDREYRNHRTWVNLEDVAPVMVRAVMAAEDGRFMDHKGIDFTELRKMRKDHKKKGTKIRGCSTISQQVAKNCFTFCGRSFWRKGFETYYTVLIELFWSKERIMEVYLNIAETGRGVFGVEEAAMRNFDRHASKLTMHQAVSIACVLPNPQVRSPKTVSQKNQKKYIATYRLTQQTAYPKW